MNSRVIRSDKNGIYVVNDRRRFRPTAPSAYKKGDKCDVVGYSSTLPLTDRKTQTSVRTWVSYPVGHPKNPNGRYPKSDIENEEIWECHDADPRIRERLRSGFHKFEATTLRGHMTVVVAGDDGYDYSQFRKDPTGFKPHITRHSTRGANVHLHINQGTSGHAQFSWAEWDALVAKVASHRDEVQVAPIAMKLQEEVDLDDQLQNYIAEKGLADEVTT